MGSMTLSATVGTEISDLFSNPSLGEHGGGRARYVVYQNKGVFFHT